MFLELRKRQKVKVALKFLEVELTILQKTRFNSLIQVLIEIFQLVNG